MTKTEVLILGAARFIPLFGPFDALPIGTIFLQNRSISRSAASALKFRVLIHTLTIAGMGDYRLGWSGLYNFLKMHVLTHLVHAFLMLITLSSSKFIFSKNGPRQHVLVQ